MHSCLPKSAGLLPLLLACGLESSHHFGLVTPDRAQHLCLLIALVLLAWQLLKILRVRYVRPDPLPWSNSVLSSLDASWTSSRHPHSASRHAATTCADPDGDRLVRPRP